MRLPTDLRKRILDRFDDMTRSEQAVAERVLQNLEGPAFLSAARLGQEIGVSESTVGRFARVLGYAGFPELQEQAQRAIQREMELVTSARLAISDERADKESLISGALAEDMNNLRLTERSLDHEQIHGIVERLVHTRRLYVVGQRATLGAAYSLAYGLRNLLEDVRPITFSADELAEEMMGVREGDVAIVLGIARPPRRSVQAARLMRSKGVHVIGVVDRWHNALTRHADELLFAHCESVAYMQSYTAVFALWHVLIAKTGHLIRDRAEQRLGELEKLLVSEEFVVE